MIKDRRLAFVIIAVVGVTLLVTQFTSLRQVEYSAAVRKLRVRHNAERVIRTRRVLSNPVVNGTTAIWDPSQVKLVQDTHYLTDKTERTKEKKAHSSINFDPDVKVKSSDLDNEELDNAAIEERSKRPRWSNVKVNRDFTQERILNDLHGLHQPSEEHLARTITNTAAFDIPAPVPFDSSWKNPCWNVSGTHHCLPYFYILGFPNSGTMDLFSRITMHPHVIPTFSRRANIWTSGRKSLNMPLSRFSQLCGMSLYSRAQSSKMDHIVGDDNLMVADYALTANGWPHGPAHFIKRYSPNAKFIVLLRNPSDRAFSQYTRINLGKNLEKTQRYFNILIRKVSDLLRTCMRTDNVRACAFSQRIRAVDQQVSLWNGLYAVYLAEWLQVFPKENFLFIKSENFSTNTRNVLQNAYNFLGLDELPDDVMTTISSAPKQNHHDFFNDNIGPLKEKSRRLLSDFYLPFTKALEDIVGDTMQW